MAGNPSSWGVSSSYEVVAVVGNKDIPLFYNPSSFEGIKRPVVDSYLGMKDGPIAAELTSDNNITVIYKGGYTLSWGEATHIFIEKYDPLSGIAKSRYNFKSKTFDPIPTVDDFWKNGTVRGNYRAEYIAESYPLFKSEVPSGYNDSYYQALKDFSFILNPPTYSSIAIKDNKTASVVNEGQIITIKVTGVDVLKGSSVFYQISSEQGITAEDFVDKKMSGSGTFNNQGIYSIAKSLASDFKTEGDEVLKFLFYSDSTLKNLVTQASVTIKDTSTDTLSASTSTVLPASYAHLTLIGTSNVNGTGNGLSNKVTGNIGKNILDGGAGKDTLTGLAGADTFKLTKLTDSLLSSYDRIVDFTFGEDKIQGPTLAKGLKRIVNSVTPTNVTDINPDTLVATLKTAFPSNTASLLTCGYQTFVAINDGTAGFDPTKDAIVEITGYQNLLSTSNLFV